MRRSRGDYVGSYPRQMVPSDDYPTRIAGCIALASAVAGFLWIYGLIFHRDEVWIPSWSQEAAKSRNESSRFVLIAPTAPQPDMHSAGIQFANSDVVSPQTQIAPDHITPTSESRVEPARHTPKPKATRVLPAGAANSYASERHYYSRREIGAE